MADSSDEESETPAAPKRSVLGLLVLLALDAINDILDWLNYTSGNPHFQRGQDGRIVWTPPSRRYCDDDPHLHRRYLHRATLRGCGCGYDGLWIFPSQCATLRTDVLTGTYRGY